VRIIGRVPSIYLIANGKNTTLTFMIDERRHRSKRNKSNQTQTDKSIFVQITKSKKGLKTIINSSIIIKKASKRKGRTATIIIIMYYNKNTKG
jgi:hypothetical protein